MCKILSLTHSKKIFHCFLSLLPQLFLFELAFKALSLFLFIPGGKELMVMMLEIAGDTSLYNYHMLQILFSFPGIAAIVLILCLSVFLAYFEFSFIFTALYHGYAGSSFSLKDTLKTSGYSVFSLNFRDIPGLFLYGILLLPLQDLYLAPSIMPRLEIPNFITGELSKRWYGDFVLDLAYALLFVLFLLLLFLLPIMILKGKSFRKSCKESIFTWKKAGIKGVLILSIFIVLWHLLFWQIRDPARRLFLCFRRKSPENSLPAFLLRKGAGNRLHRRTSLEPPLYSFPGIFRTPCRNFTPCSRRSSACACSIRRAFCSDSF